MSDLQTIFDEYSEEYGHAPNATQLTRISGVKYRKASLFLRAMKNERPNAKARIRSQTVTTYTKPIKAIFSSPKVRTSSFSEEVLYDNQNKPNSSPAVDNNPYAWKQQNTLNISTIMLWKNLKNGKTNVIRPELITMRDLIWWSTDYEAGERGIVQFNIKTNQISSVITYPPHITPRYHSVCRYNDEMYIVDEHQITSFNPRSKTFTMKKKIEDIGRGPKCIVMNDKLYIYGGSKSSKQMVYDRKSNTIKTLKFNDTTANIAYISIIKYKDKLLRFGGINWETKEYLAEFMVSNDSYDTNKEEAIKWKRRESCDLREAVIGCGCILYRDYVVIFGGQTGFCEYTDSIYILKLTLERESKISEWEVSYIKCPVASQYVAVLDANHYVHLLGAVPDNKHYCIPLSSIIKDDDVNIYKKLVIAKENESLRTKNATLQTLFDEGLYNEDKHLRLIKDQENEIEELKIKIKQIRTTNLKSFELSNEDEKTVTKLVKEKEALNNNNATLQSLLDEVLNNERKQLRAIKKKEDEMKALKIEIEQIRSVNLKLNEDQKILTEKVKEKELLLDVSLNNEQKLKTENDRIRLENIKLIDDFKEVSLELSETKKILNKVSLDPRNFSKWNSSEVVDWIIAIEDGKYAQYENILRVSFDEEGVIGSALSQVSKPDLKDWGIKNFVDRSNIFNDIQKLISQQNAQEEIEGGTAYI